MRTIRDRYPEPWPEWYRHDGEWHNGVEAQSGLYDWSLTIEDRVIEVGTYEGAWTRGIAERYRCKVDTFEPATKAREVAYHHLWNLPTVTLWPYAIGGSDRTAILYDCERDGATLEKQGVLLPLEQCIVVSMNHLIVHNRIGEIALLHLNCEGAEFEILEQMIEKDRVKQVKWFLIQWHGWEFERKDHICQELYKTHKMKWNYGYVECWERK